MFNERERSEAVSNVVAFESFQKPAPVAKAKAPKSMTLFIHIKRATLIAHCANLQTTGTLAVGRLGESRS